MRVLVFNAGSSSLRFDVFDGDVRIDSGKRERVTDIGAAAREVLAGIPAGTICVVGHRVVHGGSRFSESVLIDAHVEAALDELCGLAPLHNPQNLAAYRMAREVLPGIPHVAVFDTAFHQTLPAHAYNYAIPRRYREEYGIRRYGFHGISHRSIALRFPQYARVISCHLGNGCSVCAIENGRSIDTSMGFTPLEGLIMGTRSGDIDPGALLHLLTRQGLQPEEVLRALNSESGLYGLSGVSNDIRDIFRAEAAGDQAAGVALDAFCYRVRKYIGSYLAALNGADAIVFTGGIGENSPAIRARVCSGLDRLGISLNPGLNDKAMGADTLIGQGPVDVWAVPAGEELMIARDTVAVWRRSQPDENRDD